MPHIQHKKEQAIIHFFIEQFKNSLFIGIVNKKLGKDDAKYNILTILKSWLITKGKIREK